MTAGQERFTSSPRTALLTIGNGPLAKVVFEGLRANSQLVGVVFSQRSGRKKKLLERIADFGLWYTLQQIYMRVRCMQSGAMLAPQKIDIPAEIWAGKADEDRIRSWLLERQVDAVVVCSFHHKLGETFLSSFQACINVHASLLPKYRGPEPLTWALIERPPEVGVTLHCVDGDFDTGDILMQRSIPIGDTRTLYGLETRLSHCIPALLSHLCDLLGRGGTLECRAQPESPYYPAPSLKSRKNRCR